MRAFVTGGSGFVGRNLLVALTAAGHQARALARSDASADVVRRAGAEVVRGDLDDVAALSAGMAGCDVVYHAAAKVEVFGPRADFERVTIEGTRRVLEAARAAKVRRVVHVSTEAVLVGGRPIVQADETWPLPARPFGLYPWSKGRAEELVRAANAPEAGFETVILRPRAIWGPGDTTLLPRLAELGRRGKFAWISGGRHLTSTCHVHNLCAALLLAAERGRPGETYFITDGEPVQMRSYLGEMVRAGAGVELGERSVPRWLARAVAFLSEAAYRLFRLRGEPALARTTVRLIGEEVTVSDAKARRELGYLPVITREAGLAALVAARSSA